MLNYLPQKLNGNGQIVSQILLFTIFSLVDIAKTILTIKLKNSLKLEWSDITLPLVTRK